MISDLILAAMGLLAVLLARRMAAICSGLVFVFGLVLIFAGIASALCDLTAAGRHLLERL